MLEFILHAMLVGVQIPDQRLSLSTLIEKAKASDDLNAGRLNVALSQYLKTFPNDPYAELELLNNTNLYVRACGCYILAKHHTNVAIPRLCALINDRLPSIFQTEPFMPGPRPAVNALRGFGFDAVPELLEILSSSDDELKRREASDVIDQIISDFCVRAKLSGKQSEIRTALVRSRFESEGDSRRIEAN